MPRVCVHASALSDASLRFVALRFEGREVLDHTQHLPRGRGGSAQQQKDAPRSLARSIATRDDGDRLLVSPWLCVAHGRRTLGLLSLEVSRVYGVVSAAEKS